MPEQFQIPWEVQMARLGAPAPAQTTPQVETFERSALTVPIAPATVLDETTEFEDPGDPAKRYRIPKHALRYETFRFKQTSTGFELTGLIAPMPLDAGKESMPVTFTATLSYRLPGGGFARGFLTFTDYMPEQEGTRIRYRSTSATERTAVYDALISPEGDVRLTLDLLVTAAAPYAVEPGPDPAALKELAMRKLQTLEFGTDPPTPGHITLPEHLQTIGNLAGAGQFALAPQVLAGITRGGDGAEDTPVLAHVVLPAFPWFSNLAVVEPLVMEPVPRFQILTARISQSGHPDRQSLFFSRDVDHHVFIGVSSVGGSAGELVHRIVGDHVYLQAGEGSTRFFHLPDELRLIRRDEEPRAPVMSLAFVPRTEDSANSDDIDAVIRFAVLPWVDPGRVEAARNALRDFADGLEEVSVEPLEIASEHLQLKVRLGGAITAATVPVTAPQASLRRSFEASFTTSVTALQPAWAALRTGAASLFSGSLEIRLGESGAAVSLPFRADLERAFCTPRPLRVAAAALNADGTITASIVNTLESRVEIPALRASLISPDEGIPVTVETPLPAEGLAIEPGEAADLTLRPATAPSRSIDATAVVLDAPGLRVRTDPDRLYQAVLDPTVRQVFLRKLRLRVLASVFDDPELLILKVDVENGDGANIERPPAAGAATIFIDAGAPVTVAFPLGQYLLERDGAAPTGVTYRLQGIRRSGPDAWSAPVTDDAIGGELQVLRYR